MKEKFTNLVKSQTLNLAKVPTIRYRIVGTFARFNVCDLTVTTNVAMASHCHGNIHTTAHTHIHVSQHKISSVLKIFFRIEKDLGMASRKSIETSSSYSAEYQTTFPWSSLYIPNMELTS